MSDAIYSAMYSRNAELYHHGIQGQKWGVRNGPPYPLGSGASPRAFIEKYSNESYKGSKKSWDELDTYEKINSALLSISVGLALVRTGKAVQRWHDRRAAKKEKKTSNSSVNAEYKGKVKKEMENLTNEELSKEIQRMRLENEYNRLSKESKSEGRKWLEDTGKRVATQAIASSVSLLVNRFGNNALDAISEISSKTKILKEERRERPSRKDLKETAEKQSNPSQEILDREAALRGIRYNNNKKMEEARDRKEQAERTAEYYEQAKTDLIEEHEKYKTWDKKNITPWDRANNGADFNSTFHDNENLYEQKINQYNSIIEREKKVAKENEDEIKNIDSTNRNIR